MFRIVQLRRETADFAHEVSQLSEFDVYALTDEEPGGIEPTVKKLPKNVSGYTLTSLTEEVNGTQWRDTGSSVKVLRVSRSKCQWAGYTHAARGFHQARSMDIILPLEKSLYYFTRKDDSYRFVWLLEEDVFVPSAQSLLRVHLDHPRADFLGPKKPQRSAALPPPSLLLPSTPCRVLSPHTPARPTVRNKFRCPRSALQCPCARSS